MYSSPGSRSQLSKYVQTATLRSSSCHVTSAYRRLSSRDWPEASMTSLARASWVPSVPRTVKRTPVTRPSSSIGSLTVASSTT